MSTEECKERIGTWGTGRCCQPAIGDTGLCARHGGRRNDPAVATWYCWSRIGETISMVEVQAVTEKTLLIEGRRCAKATDYKRYFPTLDEARAAIIEYETRRRDNARRSLDEAEERLARVLREHGR